MSATGITKLFCSRVAIKEYADPQRHVGDDTSRDATCSTLISTLSSTFKSTQSCTHTQHGNNEHAAQRMGKQLGKQNCPVTPDRND